MRKAKDNTRCTQHAACKLVTIIYLGSISFHRAFLYYLIHSAELALTSQHPDKKISTSHVSAVIREGKIPHFFAVWFIRAIKKFIFEVSGQLECPLFLREYGSRRSHWLRHLDLFKSIVL